MTVLRIFGDEAGTMPKAESDSVFVAATVATLNEAPMIEQPSGHVSWLIDQLRALNAIPSIAVVQPRPGYGAAIGEKLQKMDTMARWTRLTNGANSKYLTPDGLRLRNYIWSYVMQQSVARTVISAILRTEITAIVITLDQKTMAVPARTLFETSSKRLYSQVTGTLREAREIDRAKATLYESRVKFSPGSITLRWSDQAYASGSEGGLSLAHYLATHYRRGLMRSTNSGIQTLLQDNGFTKVEIDITDLLLAPLDRNTVRKWERNTGLKEPKP